jgi:hypothetical protein
MKLSEIINDVITLVRKIRAYWARELPQRHPNYPLVNPGENSGPPPPEQKQLEDLLAGLPEDAIFQLALVKDLAWGNFTVDDLPKRYHKVKERYETPESAAFLLANNAGLADDLTDGLAELEKQGMDVDDLPVKATVNATT